MNNHIPEKNNYIHFRHNLPNPALQTVNLDRLPAGGA